MEIQKTKENTLKKYFYQKNLEVEARFGCFENDKKFKPSISLKQYERLFNFFKSKEEHYTHVVCKQLVQFDKNVKKITTTDQDGSRVLYMTKEKIVNLDFPDYLFRVGISKETTVDGVGFQEEKERTKERVRHTFTTSSAAMKIDLSMETFFDGIVSYNVELETIESMNPQMPVFLSNINLILCILQDSEMIISESETKKVLKELLKGKEKKGKRFPGIQPKTLKNEMLVNSEKYAITKKLDGVRCLMIVIGSKTFLVYKNGDIRKYPFSVDSDEFYGTIFDGEMFRGKYYIFDVIEPYLNLQERLFKIQKFMEKIKPLSDSAGIELKEYFLTDKVFETLHELSNNLDEEIYDGLIVVKQEEGYYESNPLKWKKLITFDFTLVKKQDDVYSLMMNSQDGLVEFSTIELNFQVEDDNIYECFYNEQKWYLLRQRPDKLVPNYQDTVIDNWEAVENPFCTGFEEKIVKNEKNLKIENGLDNSKRFKNYIKRFVLSKFSCNSVLDLNIGDGQDISKYIDNNIKYIEGIQEDEELYRKANSRREYFLEKPICKNFNVNLHETPNTIDKKFDLVITSNVSKDTEIYCKKGAIVLVFSSKNKTQQEIQGFDLMLNKNYSYYAKDWINIHKNSLTESERKSLFQNNVLAFLKT